MTVTRRPLAGVALRQRMASSLPACIRGEARRVPVVGRVGPPRRHVCLDRGPARPWWPGRDPRRTDGRCPAPAAPRSAAAGRCRGAARRGRSNNARSWSRSRPRATSSSSALRARSWRSCSLAVSRLTSRSWCWPWRLLVRQAAMADAADTSKARTLTVSVIGSGTPKNRSSALNASWRPLTACGGYRSAQIPIFSISSTVTSSAVRS